MKTVATILLIFLVQCTYLRAESKSESESESNSGFKQNMGKFFGLSDSCISGAKSISIYLYNSVLQGQNVSKDELCNYVNPSQQIVFVVHGFVSSGNASSFRDLNVGLVKKGFTVFSVDWSQGACTNGIPLFKFAEYPSAVSNTQAIGEFIARYVESLINKCHVPLKNIMFIGHSLGAHVSGFAAKQVQKLGLGTIPLIIAADPAKPCFSSKPCDKRLCDKDGGCVKVLHTSSLGISYPVGHQDMQFNNGGQQPGCGVNVASSHTRSIDYITYLLNNNCGFPATSIPHKIGLFERTPPYPTSDATNCTLINSNLLDPNKCFKGQYYVYVNNKPPYYTQKTFKCTQQ